MNSVRHIVWLIPFLFVAGCAEIPPRESAMIPNWQAHSEIADKKALAVIDVKGGAKPHSYSVTASDWSDRLSNDEFASVLVGALLRSQLFSSVHLYSEKRRPFNLSANIISQQEAGPGFDVDVTMLVRYQLVDEDGNELWSDNILSRHSTKFRESYDYGKRAILTREGAVRKNLKALLDELEAVILELEK